MPSAPPPDLRSFGNVSVVKTPDGPVMFSFEQAPKLGKAQLADLAAHLAEAAAEMPDEPEPA